MWVTGAAAVLIMAESSSAFFSPAPHWDCLDVPWLAASHTSTGNAWVFQTSMWKKLAFPNGLMNILRWKNILLKLPGVYFHVLGLCVCVSRCSKCAGRTAEQGVQICGAAFYVCCSFNCVSAICLVQHVEQTPFFIILISQGKHWQGHGKLLIQLSVGEEAAEDQAFGKDSMPLSRQRQETRAPFPLFPLKHHHRAMQVC